VAAVLNNLAALLQATNRLSEAEPLYRRALAIDEKSYGPEHPHVARDLNNLAALLKDRLPEAEPLMRRVLLILLKFTRETGHLHPYLSLALKNYFDLLKEVSIGDEEVRKRLVQHRCRV
jgi:tetratricopeptide (TPR) repeat protein